MRIWLAGAAAFAMAACSPPSSPAPAPPPASTAAAGPSIEGIPAGAYTLDKAHASLIVRVDHLSYSHFTARFSRWDAQMQLDPAHPESAQIRVTIDPRSIESDNPPAGFIDIMRGSEFLNAARFNAIAFVSTAVERTSANTARVTGDLTLHGVTKPVTLEATFNGGYPGMQLDPHARIGFSAHGFFKRSDFDMGYGVPPPGSTMGVGDQVEVIVESEFSGPAWIAPSPTTPQP